MAKRSTKIVTERLPARVAVLDSTAQIMQSILSAAADPNVSTEKYEQLVRMKEHMEDRAAKIDFDNALAEMQVELPEITQYGRIVIRKKDPKTGERTGVIEQKTSYAKWEDINAIIKPILHKYGFSLTFRTPIDPSGKISVTAILARGGHREETTLSYQHDTTGSKNAAQAINSSVSYGQRRTACTLLNITTRGMDDDGQRSEKLEKASEKINAKQLEELLRLADKSGADHARFCSLLKVESLADIPALRFDEAKALLEQKLRQKKSQAEKAAASDFPGDKPWPKEK